MAEFHFLRPLWLLALIPLALLLFRYGYRGGDPWQRFVDPHLLRRLRPAPTARRGRSVWLAAGGILGIVALAGPAWEQIPTLHYRPATPPLVVVLDLSRSMEATDLRPSRLAVARAALHALLDRLPPREVGLVVFAGGAHRVMPLTEDRHLIQTLLPELEPGLMPVQGSNAGAGIARAHRLLQQGMAPRGDVLLLSDGVDAGAASRAGELREAGFRLQVLGMGTPQGGRIPDPDQGVLEVGKVPLTVRLDETALRDVAVAGGGSYLRWGDRRETLSRLLQRLSPPAAGDREKAPGGGEAWLDRGPWLLLPLLLLALSGFRRGLLGLCLLPLLLPPQPAGAADWQALWLNPDQRARRLLEQGDYTGAARLFRDPLWRGTALYLAGDYEAAATSFARSDQALAHYDRGNALLRLGRTEEAIEAYQEALRKDPGYLKARRNLGLARRLLAGGAEPSPPPLTLPRRPGGESRVARPADRRPERPAPAPAPGQPPPGPAERRPPAPAGGTAGGDGRSSAVQGPGGDASGTAKGEQPAPPEKTGTGAAGSAGSTARPSSAGPPPRSAAAPPDTPPPPSEQRAGAPDEQGASAAAGGKPDRGAPQPGTGRPGATPEGSSPELSGAEKPSPDSSRDGDPEQQQAIRHWLQRVPDEPAGLLQELFRREHQRGRDLSRPGEPW